MVAIRYSARCHMMLGEVAAIVGCLQRSSLFDSTEMAPSVACSIKARHVLLVAVRLIQLPSIFFTIDDVLQVLRCLRLPFRLYHFH